MPPPSVCLALAQIYERHKGPCSTAAMVVDQSRANMFVGTKEFWTIFIIAIYHLSSASPGRLSERVLTFAEGANGSGCRLGAPNQWGTT